MLHDLRIPIPGFSANIDHIVVTGDGVTVLDSKVWKAGTYWTLVGTRRGVTKVDFADKKTIPTASDALRRHLTGFGLAPTLRRGVLVVWPAIDRAHMNLMLFRPAGARAVLGGDLRRRAPALFGAGTADPRVVTALQQLVI